MGRCDCGAKLITATLQPHQKSSGIIVFVCGETYSLPSECDAPTRVSLKRIKGMPVETHEIWVGVKRLGAVGVLIPPSQGWIWTAMVGEEEDQMKSGIKDTMNDAIKELLRCTTR